MAHVNVTELVDQLEQELRPALKTAVGNTLPEAEFDDKTLYREFRKAVSSRFHTWERVPDSCVKQEY